MKLLVDIIDWEYPTERQSYKPFVWDLGAKDKLFGLMLTFGNGIILEFRAEADSEEALDVLRNIIKGIGACQPAILTLEEQQKLWLYAPDHECYTQGNPPQGYIFVNPIPQPDNFVAA
jgi:hypothetical protein